MNKANAQSIVFFGTGQTSLDALKTLAEEFVIEAVITKPDSTKHSKARPTEVAAWARQNAISVYKPAGKKELSTLVADKQFRSSIGVVLDYGVIIPEDVIDSFEHGIVNSHFSLLPSWRGADPIRAAILHGDEVTGVTIMLIVPELDAGPILSWGEMPLNDSTNAIDLRTQLSEINCALLPETIQLYIAGDIELMQQDETAATFTTKTQKEDGLLDPSLSPQELLRQINAYAGWPKSYFDWNDNQVVITKALSSAHNAPEGTLSVDNGKLYYGCQGGSLEIIEIQPAGKKPMDSKSFINGYKNLL